MTQMLIKQYLSITKKSKRTKSKSGTKRNKFNGNRRYAGCVLELLDNISDETIKNYLYAVGQFKLPSDVDTPNTQIIYFYGGKINEFVFRT